MPAQNAHGLMTLTNGFAPMPLKIRVLCVDDSDDIPEMLGRCIALEPDLESVGSLSSADRLREEVSLRHADVVLLDMKMPGRDPIAALAELSRDAAGRDVGSGVRVIAFSGRDDEEAVAAAARAGADGFLSKDADMRCIFDAIREVARGAPFQVWKSSL